MIGQDVRKASVAFKQCKTEHCPKYDMEAEEAKKRKFISKLIDQYMAGTITADAMRARFKAYLDKRENDTKSIENMRCAIENCKKELVAVQKALAKISGMKYQASQLKTVRDNFAFSAEVAMRILNKLIDELPPKAKSK